MPFLIAIGSFRDHFCTSSFIFWILLGFMAHKQPFLWLPFEAGFSIFSKHLFKLKLCRTEFFHPLGAFLKYGKCSLKNIKERYMSSLASLKSLWWHFATVPWQNYLHYSKTPKIKKREDQIKLFHEWKVTTEPNSLGRKEINQAWRQPSLYIQ